MYTIYGRTHVLSDTAYIFATLLTFPLRTYYALFYDYTITKGWVGGLGVVERRVRYAHLIFLEL